MQLAKYSFTESMLQIAESWQRNWQWIQFVKGFAFFVLPHVPCQNLQKFAQVSS